MDSIRDWVTSVPWAAVVVPVLGSSVVEHLGDSHAHRW